MKVAHVVNKANSTAFSADIAVALNNKSDVESSLVPCQPVDSAASDIPEEVIRDEFAPVTNYRTLVKDVESEGFDIIHTHNIRSSARVFLAARWLGTELVLINTQHSHMGQYSLPQQTLNVASVAAPDGLIFNSRATQDSYTWLEDVFLRRKPQFVVYNGVDMSKIDPHAIDPAKYTIQKPTSIVTATRLIPRKNLRRVISALSYLDGVTLRIIGDGPHRPELENFATEYGVQNRVEFTGYLPKRTYVYAEMAKGDIFTLPSHGEGFGVAVVEAMALGLPVVVSDIPVFHEVVGESGVFVDRMDPKAIASGIGSLCENPERSQTLGKNNRKRVLEKFTMEQTVRGYSEVYSELLGK